MRSPHWLAPSHGAVYPVNCIWFDTETDYKLDAQDRQHHFLDFGFAAHRRKIPNGNWSKPDWLRFTTNKEFWEFVDNKTRPKVKLYLFAHNGAFDLPTTHAFHNLPSLGYKLVSAVADAPPLILKWRKENKTIVFIDTLNIWRMPLAKLGKSIGLPKLSMPPKNASRKLWDAYGKRDTEIIMQACLNWWQFLEENDYGSFAPTLASQSMSTFRHRFMKHRIFIDSNEKALEIARKSYVGGRTEAHRLGKYKGKFYYVDFNSMYPDVMHKNNFPHKLVGVYKNPSMSEINKWIDHFAMIVECEIETEEPIYPIIHDKRLVFPVGNFRVSLCGPEFRIALDRGHVKNMYRIALYDQAPIFKDFIAEMYPLKEKAAKEGDIMRKDFFKILQNSLYGKTGQRGRRFEVIGECDVNEIAVWTELDIDAGEVIRKRRFGGLEQSWINEGESKDSFPAIASYVTSYARVKLWNAMELAGLENVYYNDTDSLLLNERGFKKIEALIDATKLGALALESEHKEIIIYGAKDYVLDGVQKTKGVRKTADWIDQNSVIQDVFVGFKGLLMEGDLTGPIVFRQKKTLSREYKKGLPQTNGKVKPLRL